VWDVFAAELPNALHPVAWFGRLAGGVRARLPLTPPLVLAPAPAASAIKGAFA
jgi:cobalamin biosynthesis protein CobD/CbiB